jgi:hypothetical protein
MAGDANKPVPSLVLEARLRSAQSRRRTELGGGLALWVLGLGVIASTFVYDWSSDSLEDFDLEEYVVLGGLLLIGLAAVLWVCAHRTTRRIEGLEEDIAWAHDREPRESPARSPTTPGAGPGASGNRDGWFTLAGAILSAVATVIARRAWREVTQAPRPSPQSGAKRRSAV